MQVLPRIVASVLLLAAVGAAPAGRADEPSPESRFVCWTLGSRLSLIALASARGADGNAVGAKFNALRSIAETFGVSLPALPARTGNKAEDMAAVLAYLLNGAGDQMGKEIAARYPDDHVALFELGLKSNILLVMYAPDDELGHRIGTVINDRARTARLPANLWRGVVTLIGEAAGVEDVNRAVLKMHAEIGKYLAPK